MSKAWSLVEQHLNEYKVKFTYINLAGTNSHTLEAWIGGGTRQTVNTSLANDQFAEADLRTFFRALHIGYPSWL